MTEGAQLIAALEDNRRLRELNAHLLAVMKAVESELDQLKISAATVDKLRAAIAKAKGRA